MTPEQRAIHDAAAALQEALMRIPDATDDRAEKIRIPLLMVRYGANKLVTRDVQESLDEGSLADLNPHLDHKDLILLIGHLAAWDLIEKPRVGDLVKFTGSDAYHRIAHKWDDGYQTAPGGSYHLGDGYMSMSGGLDRSIPIEEFVDTHNRDVTSAWMWHHDRMEAHNGVNVRVFARIYSIDREGPR